MRWSDLFCYDPIAGVLKWKVSLAKNVKCGAIAGSLTNRGYLVVTVAGRRVLAHRVVWEMCNGEIPEGMEVDHINHSRADNRISNLRLVSRQENLRNQSRYSNNTSGVTGVCYDKIKNKWRAHITVSGRTISLGKFVDFESAVAARSAAEAKYFFHINHGA